MVLGWPVALSPVLLSALTPVLPPVLDSVLLLALGAIRAPVLLPVCAAAVVSNLCGVAVPLVLSAAQTSVFASLFTSVVASGPLPVLFTGRRVPPPSVVWVSRAAVRAPPPVLPSALRSPPLPVPLPAPPPV